MNRFTDFRPQLVEIKYGPEPSLFEILTKYYSEDLDADENAEQLAREYIEVWLMLEKRAADSAKPDK